MATERATCARCGERFDVAENIGTLRCRRHGQARPTLDAQFVMRYACCGLAVADEARLRTLLGTSLLYAAVQTRDLRGCTPIDHLPLVPAAGGVPLLQLADYDPEGSEQAPESSYRTAPPLPRFTGAADDEEDAELFAVVVRPAYLLGRHRQRAHLGVPVSGLPTGNVSLDQARSLPSAATTITLAGANGQQRSVDLRDRLAAFCERAYRDPRYHAALPNRTELLAEAMAHLTHLRMPSSSVRVALPRLLDADDAALEEAVYTEGGGGGDDDTDLIERTQGRRQVPPPLLVGAAVDEAETLAFYLLTERTDFGVPFEVVRRAAPAPDPAALYRIGQGGRVASAILA